MIDIEIDVWNAIKAVLPTGTSLETEYPIGDNQYPMVTMAEGGNSTYERTVDSSLTENHASVMYEFNIYSNKVSGPRAECKSIRNEIDDKMQELGFTRNYGKFLPNLMDGTITRYVLRYSGVAGKDKTIYRR